MTTSRCKPIQFGSHSICQINRALYCEDFPLAISQVPAVDERCARTLIQMGCEPPAFDTSSSRVPFDCLSTESCWQFNVVARCFRSGSVPALALMEHCAGNWRSSEQLARAWLNCQKAAGKRQGAVQMALVGSTVQNTLWRSGLCAKWGNSPRGAVEGTAAIHVTEHAQGAAQNAAA